MTLAFCDSEHDESNKRPEYGSYQQFRLEILSGPDTGKVLVASKARTVIGSDPSADLCVCDPEVAAFQCELVAREERIDIHDLTGDNSTLVNDIEVATAHLSRPAMIVIGGTRIRFERISARLHVRRSSSRSYGALVGESTAMRDLFTDMERIQDSDESAHIIGAAGSGKKAVARALHIQSPRAQGPFFVVDCSAPDSQVERDMIAAFERARGGSLYLEHVGKMSEDLQARLLRVYHRGGPAAVANLRIMSSSTVDIRALVNEGLFDAELHRMLTGAVLRVPAMKERFADLPRLVEAFLLRTGLDKSAEASELRSPEFMEHLQRQGWIGSLRDLCLYVQGHAAGASPSEVSVQPANINHTPAPQAPLMAEGSGPVAVASPMASTPDVDISRPIKAGREEWIKHFERLYLGEILDSQGGNVTRAAKAAGVDRGHFYRLMMRCGMRD